MQPGWQEQRHPLHLVVLVGVKVAVVVVGEETLTVVVRFLDYSQRQTRQKRMFYQEVGK